MLFYHAGRPVSSPFFRKSQAYRGLAPLVFGYTTSSRRLAASRFILRRDDMKYYVAENRYYNQKNQVSETTAKSAWEAGDEVIISVTVPALSPHLETSMAIQKPNHPNTVEEALNIVRGAILGEY